MTLLKLLLLALAIAGLLRYGDNPNRRYGLVELGLSVAMLLWLVFLT